MKEGDLKKKFKKIFDGKFKGTTTSTNIIDTSAEVLNSKNVTYFNRKEHN